MLGSAGLGMFTQPNWHNASSTTVDRAAMLHYDSDRAESLFLHRVGRSEGAGADAHARAANVGGSDRSPAPKQQIKRKWSTRLSETLHNVGKNVKKRADSWNQRKHSPTAPKQRLRAFSQIANSARLPPGSGERSRDGDDEMSSSSELLVRSSVACRQSAVTGLPIRNGSLQTGRLAIERAQYRYPAPAHTRAHEPLLAPYNMTEGVLHGKGRDEDAEARRWYNYTTRERLMIMERRVRIAERSGDFSPVGREAMFKKSHKLQSRTSEQSQASIKLKKKVAERQQKSDRQFQRWKEGSSGPPLLRLWDRVRRRSSGGEKSQIEANLSYWQLPGDSGFLESEESELDDSTTDEDSDDEWREGNVEALRYAGWALQSALAIFFSRAPECLA